MSVEGFNRQSAITPNDYTLFGALLVLAYCILSAAKEVVIGHYVQEIDPYLLVFVSFSFVILIFNSSVLWQRKQYCAAWRGYRKSLPSFVHLNVETMLAWGCFFWAVRFLEPAVVSAVTVGLSPLFAQHFAPCESGNATLARKALASAAISLFLLVATLAGFSAVGHVSPRDFAIGSILCVVGAAAIAQVTSRARKLYEKGYTALDLMRARFFGLVGGAGIALAVQESVAIDMELFAVALLIAVFGIAVPIYSLQRGLERCNSTITLLIIASAPGFTWLFQLADPRLEYSLVTSFAIIALFLVAIWCIFEEESTTHASHLIGVEPSVGRRGSLAACQSHIQRLINAVRSFRRL